MPLPTPRITSDYTLTAFTSNGGASTSITTSPIVVPRRSKVIEVGYSPNSLTAAATVISIATILFNGTTGASTQLIASTAAGMAYTSTSTAPGAVHSLERGGVFSAIPPSPIIVNGGDALAWTTSGGNSSAIGMTCYAVLRPV